MFLHLDGFLVISYTPALPGLNAWYGFLFFLMVGLSLGPKLAILIDVSSVEGKS